MTKNKWNVIKSLRLPAICALCSDYHQRSGAVCHDCHQLFVPLGTTCQQCACLLPDSDFLICGQCIKKKPAFDTVTATYRFEEPLRTLLHQFKYNQSLHLTSSLATMMLQCPPPQIDTTECLIPVPMHPKKLQQRGYNQAAELTKRLSCAINKPYQLTQCAKIKNTTAQARLSGKERLNNVRQSFSVKPTPLKHITLIDDLLTTGSTANELAGLFKKQGVLRISVWCCARA